MRRSISIPFSLVKAKICSGAPGCAKSATNTSVFTPCFVFSSFERSTKRSSRRAVKTRCVPPAASSRASATPIPALAPVTRAHFPRHSALMFFFASASSTRCDVPFPVSPGFLSFPNFFVLARNFYFLVTVKRSRFLCDRKTVNEASAFVSDAVHQPARPHKFCRKQTQSDKNREQAGSRRDQHDYARQQQGKSGDDEEHATDLLDGAKDHRPLGIRLSGGEGSLLSDLVRRHPCSKCALQRDPPVGLIGSHRLLGLANPSVASLTARKPRSFSEMSHGVP